MWPFRWLHLYLCAPPPAYVLRVPLLDAIFPFIIALPELPEQWGYRTYYSVPQEVVTGVLKHDYVHANPNFETSGGLKGVGLKLPEGRHTAFLKQVAQAKKKLRTKELDTSQAVKIVREAAEAEVKRLVDVIRRYAVYQVADVRSKVALGTEPSHTEDASLTSSPEQRLQSRCLELALDCESFMAWLSIDNPEATTNAETVCFYRTFFQTQLCIELLNEELVTLTSKLT